MRVLLTGSSGWLGRFLAPQLRAAGHAVVGLDVAPGANTDVIGSVADRALIDAAFADYVPEAVIHAGALHKPDIVRYERRAFIDVNVSGTLHLLEAAVRAGHDRFVFTSTTSLMISQAIRDEAGDEAIWLDETSEPIAPRNIYGITKCAAEQLCRLFHLTHGLSAIVLRTARFFPENDDTHLVLSGENMKTNEFPPPIDGGGRGSGARRSSGARADGRLRYLHRQRAAALFPGRPGSTQARRAGGDRTLFPRCTGALRRAPMDIATLHRADL